MKVLDHGFVELEASCASDLDVVNAAKVSFNKHSSEVGDPEKGLINFLMKNHHGTPFEHNFFKFRVKAPIFVFREWHRHRIGISINEMSARYTELSREWYIPRIEHVRRRVGKPGHYVYENMFLGSKQDAAMAQEFLHALNESCTTSYAAYKTALECGIAPEQARMFLHVNHYSEMYWSCNARSLMNFLNLRAAPTAQWEIQQYANVLEEIWKEIMPVTWEAFNNNGRISP